MMDFVVEILGNVRLFEDVFGVFIVFEILDGENKYKCNWFVLYLIFEYFVIEEVIQNLCNVFG